MATQRILIADGDSERGKRIAESCAARGLDYALASHGAAALEAALIDLPAVLVAQLDLPLIDGPQLGAILRANPRTRDTLVFLVCDRAADVARARAGLPSGDEEAGDGEAAEGLPAAGNVFGPPLDLELLARAASAVVTRVAEATREAEGPAESGGVEGQLAQLPLADLLQLFHVLRKTGIVAITRGEGEAGGSGRVSLRGGDVVHATVGGVEGEKALYRLLAWRRGSFVFLPEPVAGEPTIQAPTRALLREGQRQLAERERLSVDLPPLDAHVKLRIQRASLPNVIHPLTQEVLLVLELYSRVRDVVDHCSFPDYQVLRTLRTLLDRGMLALSRDPVPPSAPAVGALVTPEKAARLREWLEAGAARGTGRRDAKLPIVASDPGALRDLAQLLQGLPGVAVDARAVEGGLAPDSLASFGHVVLAGADAAEGETPGIELIHVPIAERFAPLWTVAAHGALAQLFVLSAPLPDALERTRQVADALRRLPRARGFHLLLLEKGENATPEIAREHFALFDAREGGAGPGGPDESSLFLVPPGRPEKAAALLGEMFARLLP